MARAAVAQPSQPVVPEGWVYVKPLQQGPVFAAPNEIRLVSDNAAQLRHTATASRESSRTRRAANTFTPIGAMKSSRSDSTCGQRSRRVSGCRTRTSRRSSPAHSRALPSSTFWEGKRDLDVTFRLDGAERRGWTTSSATTLVSPATGARVAVREVADVAPEFRASRIVRRNGVRTLTVLSFAAPDILPSVVLKAATPKLAALKLPAGMRMEFGGEKEGSAEVQGAVNVALLASLVGVFLILLFQFRTVRHPLVIMTSIPLAVVGAALGS